MRLLGTLLLALSALVLAGCGKGSVQSPDFTSVLQSLTVTPDPAQIDGDAAPTRQFTAVGNFTNPPGSDSPTHEDSVDGVEWSSSDTAIATIDSAGIATGVSDGVVTITASKGGKEGTAQLTVFFEQVVTITVTPDTTTSPAGIATQFTATLTCRTNGGPEGACTRPHAIDWSVANVAGDTNPAPVASIDSTTGVATGQRVGTATVTATVHTQPGKSDTAEFNVTPPILVALDVTPDTATIPLGTTQEFTATGIYSNNTTTLVQATWVSADPTIGALENADAAAKKNVRGAAKGDTTITATYHDPETNADLTDASTLTVGDAVLTSFVRVEPQLGRVTVGRQIEYTAIGGFSDGTEHPLDDAQVTWTIANNPGSGVDPVATIDANGVASGLIIGSATVTATLVDATGVTGPASQTARLTVTDTVCTTPLIAAEGATSVGEVSATCLGCTVANPENIINPPADDFAAINVPVGLLGGAAGVRVDANDNANYALPFTGGSNAGFFVSKPAGTLVVAELLSQIQLSTLLGDAVQETTSAAATPLRVELLGQEVVGGARFDTALVSIKTTVNYDALRLSFNSGLVSALSGLQVGAACGTAEIPPPAAALVQIARVEPATSTVIVGGAQGLTALGSFGDAGVESPLPNADLVWSSLDPAIATVDSNGVVTGVAPGTAVIKAALRPGVPFTGTVVEATATVTVLESGCATKFLATDGATVESGTTGLCLLCSVADTANVIDDQPTTGARMGVNIGLLGAGTFVTVTQDASLGPQPAGQRTGFLIGRPTGTLLKLELLSQITVSALRDGVVVASAGYNTSPPLRLDLLGVEVVEMNDFALLTITPAAEYDSIRIDFNSGLAGVGLQNQLTNVKVYEACESTDAVGTRSMVKPRKKK